MRTDPNTPAKRRPKGDGNITIAGYLLISVGKRRIFEHRYVMEQHLDRRLTRKEDVHHINHNTLDNRIENLQVLSKSEHTKMHLAERWSKHRKRRNNHV